MSKGDHSAGNFYKQTGPGSTMNFDQRTAQNVDVDAAVAELRALIDELKQSGAVSPDGEATDPNKITAAVKREPGRLAALAAAIAGGAQDAVLGIVKDGVAAWIVAITGQG